MGFINIEIKARCERPERIREFLQERGAVTGGTDRQTDTYFNVPSGRLKLRQGNIENSLIYYERPDETGPKKSTVSMYHVASPEELKETLSKALGVLIVVEKIREIYFIDNVKFHLDLVRGLGSFVEIEAIDAEGTIGESQLRKQCDMFTQLLGIRPEDLVARSYSDSLLSLP